jgi:hypothetical protein
MKDKRARDDCFNRNMPALTVSNNRIVGIIYAVNRHKL